jgi:hypothetical protein
MKTRIWNLTETFPDKVNFIDSNNVILGYDLLQSCCEDAFWTISEKQDGSDPIYEGSDDAVKEIELDGYCFDPKFCERKSYGDDGEDFAVSIFKLVGSPWLNPKLPDLFLRLENHHNGYYSHGFTFRGDVIINGSL